MVRYRFEAGLFAFFVGLTALTLLWPSWIERLTGLDPDGGDGVTEWVIVVGLVALSVTFAILARRDRRSSPASSLSAG